MTRYLVFAALDPLRPGTFSLVREFPFIEYAESLCSEYREESISSYIVKRTDVRLSF